MERKNTILLTVIAIATLLVAVVGATFAYFTATVTTKENDNAGATFNSARLANIEFKYGNSITPTGAIYPGFADAKEMVLTVKCPAGSGDNCADTKAKLTVTDTGLSDFKGDLTWAIYKSTSSISAVSGALPNAGLCKNVNHIPGTNTADKDHPTWFYTTHDCPSALTSLGDPIMSSTNGIKTLDLTLNASKTEYYYLFVDYVNKEDDNSDDEHPISGDQKDQQGKTFTVTMNFAQDVTVPTPVTPES